MTSHELLRFRTELNLSQDAMVDLLGMGQFGRRTLGRWESGVSPIPGPAAFAVRVIVLWHRSGQSVDQIKEGIDGVQSQPAVVEIDVIGTINEKDAEQITKRNLNKVIDNE